MDTVWLPSYVELWPGTDSGVVFSEARSDTVGFWHEFTIFERWRRLSTDSIELHFSTGFSHALFRLRAASDSLTGRGTLYLDYQRATPSADVVFVKIDSVCAPHRAS